jgi:hypothetical protein
MKDLGRSKYKQMLEDKDFRRWYDNVTRGSLVTAQEWFRRIGFVCARFETTPQKIARMSQKQATDFLLDVIGTLEKEGRSGNYISNIVKPLKSWLAWNDTQITRAIKIPRSQPTKVENERPPTQEELKKILNAAELRAKVACSLVAFGGCRIEVLGNYTGDDGLKMKDLPEIKIENGKVTITKTPTMMIARKTLSKAGHQYFTFLAQEGCHYLQEYLEWRLRKGEELLPESPLITFHERKGKYVKPEDVGRKHITSINIGDIIRKPIRRAGFDWRPYVLRRYFDVRMMMAEGDGLIIRDWREFWMGHKGDIEATYTVNKAVTQDTIEKMREAYRKCEPLMSTEKQEGISQENLKNVLREQLLLAAGAKDDEVNKLDLDKMSNEDFQDLLRRRLLGVMTNNGNRQKIIPASDLKSHVSQGWEYVAQLSDSEVVVRLPS